MKQATKKEALTWVEVDLGAIDHNIREFKRITGGLDLMPIVKGNAYGHGIEEVALQCQKTGVEYLGVVSIDEALTLRACGVALPVFVLGYVGALVPKDAIREAVKQEIELVVVDTETAHLLSRVAKDLDKDVKVHVKVDTGCTRIGVLPENFAELIDDIQELPNIVLEGIFTHFQSAEEDTAVTNRQIEVFQGVQDELKTKGVSVPRVHAACSAALMNFPASYGNLGRLGVSLYGLWPSDLAKEQAEEKIHLRPALSWHTKVVQVKDVPAGAKISYGGTYEAPRDMKLAVLAVGYADGYSRHLSNAQDVIILGKRAPIRGRVCMNLTMVDVTGIDGVASGTKATLLGKNGDEEVTASELASHEETINYEVVTAINWTLPRFYKHT